MAPTVQPGMHVQYYQDDRYATVWRTSKNQCGREITLNKQLIRRTRVVCERRWSNLIMEPELGQRVKTIPVP